MTSKTSLFNLGIYTNILRKFKWGGFLYAIILFFSVPFVFLVQNPEKLANRSQLYYEIFKSEVILQAGYMVIPYLLAMAVPTVMAILILGNVHSVKQGIFSHSLPVTRSTNYVSSLLGSFTLMYAPILLNGIILAIMSLCGYGKTISMWSIFLWIAIQVSVIFIMFSVAVISGFLTGHQAAHGVINVIIHTLPLLVALAIVLVSDVFLYGFTESDSFIANRISLNTPIVWLFTQLTKAGKLSGEMFKSIQLWLYITGAAILYILGYILYAKRKIEACGEVAAFKVFRPILKYTLTVASAVCALGILWATELGAVATFTVAAVVSAVVYFACEMLISKTVKVFGRYKGYCVFAFCMAAVICFCAFTSIFGYETRIPEKSDIAKATVYQGYYRYNAHPLVEDSNAIDDVIRFHEEIISYIPLTERAMHYPNSPYTGNIHIKYELKNGKIFDRYYPVTNEMTYKMLSKMYEYPEYKMRVTGIDMLNIENVNSLTLHMSSSGYHYEISLNEDSSEFMKAIKKDIEMLTYNELCDYSHAAEFNVHISVSKEENEKSKVFDDSAYPNTAQKYEINDFNIGVNSHFENSVAFLKEKGYYDTFMDSLAQSLWICKLPVDKSVEKQPENSDYESSEIIVYKTDKGMPGEFRISLSDCVQPDYSDALSLAELMFETERHDIKEGKNYLVFARRNDSEIDFWLSNNTFSFTVEELPEYLRKYVE